MSRRIWGPIAVVMFLTFSAQAGERPERIVSVGGSVTETLYALGLGDRIVGVDTTSLYPREALASKPNVGYMRQLSPEGVLSLHPQMVLSIAGAGPKEALETLSHAGVPLATVPETYSESGLLAKIAFIANRMQADPRGECLQRAVSADFTALGDLRRKIGKPARVMFVMSFVNGRAMAAGDKTAADAIIRLAGGINALEGFEGYKPVSDEAIAAAQPDVVLSMARDADALTADAVFGHPAFALTPAAKTRAFVAMDGNYLLGFGPRTAAAAHDLAVKLYPSLNAGDGWRSRVADADCRT